MFLVMSPRTGLLALLIVSVFLAVGPTRASEGRITHDLPYVEVLHGGKPARIERNPDTGNMIDPDFTLTSRPCPPYCIQPMHLVPGVES